MLIKGKDLNKRQIELVKSAYVHRHTFEHRAAWANGSEPTQSDTDWINDHAFYFVKDGSRLMLNRRHCEPHYFADSLKNQRMGGV